MIQIDYKIGGISTLGYRHDIIKIAPKITAINLANADTI